MALSKTYRERARFLIIEKTRTNVWCMRVFDPRKAKGTSYVTKYLARTLVDVRRIARSYMGKYSIRPELVYHDIDDLVRFLGSKKKPIPEEYAQLSELKDTEQDTVKDTTDGGNDADTIDDPTPSVHGSREAILVSKGSGSE